MLLLSIYDFAATLHFQELACRNICSHSDLSCILELDCCSLPTVLYVMTIPVDDLAYRTLGTDVVHLGICVLL